MTKEISSTEQITPIRKDFPYLQEDKTAAVKFALKHKKTKGRVK